MLAKEERSHAALLATLNRQLDAGHMFWNIGHFSEEAIAEEYAFIRIAVNLARSSTPSEEQCLTTALHIEKSIIDSKFYATVKSDSNDFDHVCQALSRATKIHLQKLWDKAAEVGTDYSQSVSRSK